MIPRGTPDIGWGDLAAGLRDSLRKGDAYAGSRRLEEKWSPEGEGLACLSVRSGFDLVLRALALPAGSEVLVSAVTIGDMVRLLLEHGLRAVPVDVESRTLSIDPGALERAVTGKTRAILIAHLFGSRMPMDPIAAVARKHGLHLFEDCAQAFDGSDYRRHAESDVSLFSFGPIKTATALGDGLLRIRDRELRERAQQLHEAYPVQPAGEYRRRLLRFAGLKLLTQPHVFGGFVRLCRRRGIDHDQLLSASVRGFAGPDFLSRIRRRPCAALVRMMGRRVKQDHKTAILLRRVYACKIATALPGVALPGCEADPHSHWAIPFPSRDPHGLVATLQNHGFDATCRASSLVAVNGPSGETELPSATRMIAGTVYLPAWPSMGCTEVWRLAEILTAFESVGQAGSSRWRLGE